MKNLTNTYKNKKFFINKFINMDTTSFDFEKDKLLENANKLYVAIEKLWLNKQNNFDLYLINKKNAFTINYEIEVIKNHFVNLENLCQRLDNGIMFLDMYFTIPQQKYFETPDFKTKIKSLLSKVNDFYNQNLSIIQNKINVINTLKKYDLNQITFDFNAIIENLENNAKEKLHQKISNNAINNNTPLNLFDITKEINMKVNLELFLKEIHSLYKNKMQNNLEKCIQEQNKINKIKKTILEQNNDFFCQNIIKINY